jgi:hypothetical protein
MICLIYILTATREARKGIPSRRLYHDPVDDTEQIAAGCQAGKNIELCLTD